MSLSANLNQFAFKLYERLATGKNENFFISPYSISAALSMCLAGARDETHNQLKDLLNLTSLSNDQISTLNGEYIANLNNLGKDVALNTANKIFQNQGFEVKADFENTLQKFYGSSSQQLNFAESEESAKVINDWVSEQTKDKIKDLIPSNLLNSLTRLVLVNAIYFKGSWMNKFDAANTYKEDFHLADGTTKKVDMMKLTNKKFKYHLNPCGIIGIACQFPYAGDSVAMTIVLPHPDYKLEDVERILTGENIASLLEAEVREITVHAHIPKFKLEYESQLSDHLKALGADHAFDANKANFTGIADLASGLFISEVVHKAVVEVNEEGTVAAAATGAIMMTRCAMVDYPEEFKCDRPFMFFIFEKKTNGILFMGKYVNPE